MLSNRKKGPLWCFFKNVIWLIEYADKCIFNTSGNTKKKFDRSLFVQRPFLGAEYFKSEIEENIDLTNQYRIETLKDQISIREADSKN